MIQVKVNIDVTPECFVSWKPEEMNEFFRCLTQLMAIKGIYDRRAKIVEIDMAKGAYVETLEMLKKCRELFTEKAAEEGVTLPDAQPTVAREAESVKATTGGGRFGHYREKAASYLARHGPTSKSYLCRVCEIPTGSMAQVFGHEWFESESDGLHLSSTGFAFVNKDRLDDAR